MPKFHVSYKFLKTFPEGTDERIVEVEVDDPAFIAGIASHPEMQYVTIVRLPEPEKKPRKKKEKKDA